MGIFLIGIAVAAISLTVTRSDLFRPFRNDVRNVKFLGKVLTCPYCFSHWMAAILSIFYQPELKTYVIIEWFIGLFCIVAISVPIMALINFSLNFIPPETEENL